MSNLRVDMVIVSDCESSDVLEATTWIDLPLVVGVMLETATVGVGAPVESVLRELK
jgi:hypothetical protein